MNSLPTLKIRLLEEISELCEACFAEHELLEEGTDNFPRGASRATADETKAAA